MSELFLKPLQAYVKMLCVKHKLLLHNDANKVVFIPFQSGKASSAIKNNAAQYFVSIDHIMGSGTGEVGSQQLRQEVTILFIKRTNPPAGNPDKEIEDAQAAALAILLDFYARMQHEYQEDDCGDLRGLIPEQMAYEPIDGPIWENHYGWVMTLPYKVMAPGHDPSKWNA